MQEDTFFNPEDIIGKFTIELEFAHHPEEDSAMGMFRLLDADGHPVSGFLSSNCRHEDFQEAIKDIMRQATLAVQLQGRMLFEQSVIPKT